MSDFIRTNDGGYVRKSAVVSLLQVRNDYDTPPRVQLRLEGATLYVYYVDGTIEDVLVQLEGSEPTRPEKAPSIRSQEVSKPAQERLGFGSVVDAKNG